MKKKITKISNNYTYEDDRGIFQNGLVFQGLHEQKSSKALDTILDKRSKTIPQNTYMICFESINLILMTPCCDRSICQKCTEEFAKKTYKKHTKNNHPIYIKKCINCRTTYDKKLISPLWPSNSRRMRKETINLFDLKIGDTNPYQSGSLLKESHLHFLKTFWTIALQLKKQTKAVIKAQANLSNYL